MGGALAKYERETGKVTVFPMPSTNAIPYGIVSDRNDNLFIADWGSGKIVKFDTKTNAWTEFTPPTYPGQTRRPNVDYQNNVWWGIWAAGKRPGKLAKLDQTTGRITEYTIPEQNAQPYDVVQYVRQKDRDGNQFSREYRLSNQVGVIDHGVRRALHRVLKQQPWKYPGKQEDSVV